MPTIPPPSTFSLSSCSTDSSLDTLLKEQFERCRHAGILRNDPLESNVLRKSIPGKLGLIAEYEPNLFAHKRVAAVSSANSPQVINMEEPFNANKFNFTKVGPEEVLVRVQPDDETSHPILVNVSPLMYGHGLLIPWVQQGLPQQLTSDAVGLALQLLRASQNGTFCIGFNSLGAFSSVNHLHLHILYPGELDHETRLGGNGALTKGRQNFPIADAPVQQTVVAPADDISLRVDRLDWMVPSFSFQAKEDIDALQQAVARFVRYLHSQRIPHNVLFLQQNPIRVIVIPRKPQHNFDSSMHGFNAALGEISGMLIAKTQEHFEGFTEATIRAAIQHHVACEEEVLSKILSELKGGLA